ERFLPVNQVRGHALSHDTLQPDTRIQIGFMLPRRARDQLQRLLLPVRSIGNPQLLQAPLVGRSLATARAGGRHMVSGNMEKLDRFTTQLVVAGSETRSARQIRNGRLLRHGSHLRPVLAASNAPWEA